ncbi:uncharacterized protein F5891DRAFT_1254189 [Suillus fuscotomentosus]|uniref:Uncharacterized protein n=1 Tax=Suillus fuscotomentosus TaxID=1912939 RepID=A0AAD4HGV7_9AGAM|nr:uncharacterized protein F5891DRAFT_1254189 [Suillus fuscotomentosus]KAG1895019.1 hypothetical protein F5891DRAFT_1254189 [Suillus fuscotomentosus]
MSSSCHRHLVASRRRCRLVIVASRRRCRRIALSSHRVVVVALRRIVVVISSLSSHRVVVVALRRVVIVIVVVVSSSSSSYRRRRHCRRIIVVVLMLLGCCCRVIVVVIAPSSSAKVATLSMCSEYTERPNSLDAPASEESESSRRSIARQRFKGAVRSVIMMQQQQAGQVPLYLRPFMPPRIPSFDRNSTAGMSPTRFSSIGPFHTYSPCSASIVLPKRKISRYVKVRYDFFVASPADMLRQVGIGLLSFFVSGQAYEVLRFTNIVYINFSQESFSTRAVLVHVRGFIGQVAWSATGTILLTRLTRGIKVWTEDGLSKRTIDRPHSVSSIAWLPNSDTHFFSVEGSDVFRLDIQGKVLDSYHFGRIQLHNVAVTPDGQRLLGVGPLLAAPLGLKNT